MKEHIRDRRITRISEIENAAESHPTELRGNTQLSVQPTEPADGGMLFATEIDHSKNTRPTK